MYLKKKKNSFKIRFNDNLDQQQRYNYWGLKKKKNYFVFKGKWKRAKNIG